MLTLPERLGSFSVLMWFVLPNFLCSDVGLYIVCRFITYLVSLITWVTFGNLGKLWILYYSINVRLFFLLVDDLAQVYNIVLQIDLILLQEFMSNNFDLFYLLVKNCLAQVYNILILHQYIYWPILSEEFPNAAVDISCICLESTTALALHNPSTDNTYANVLAVMEFRCGQMTL